MKKIFLLSVVALLFTACIGSSKKEANAASEEKENGIEVLYFHGKKRCITCNAIEKLSKEVLEQDFAEEMASGAIVMKVVDISLPENEAVVNKYEVTWSSLYASKWIDGVESNVDLTKLGFSYAKNQPEEFKKLFKMEIEKLLEAKEANVSSAEAPACSPGCGKC